MRMTKSAYARYQHGFATTEGLADVVRRLIQEVEVLKTMLRDQGKWDEGSYRKALTDQFVSDHYSGGAMPETARSHYPYLLDEASELKHRFQASDQEMDAFKRQVEDVSYLT
jgi:hypothetical protein